MSSSPVPNLGIISGATGSTSPLRQRVEEIEDQARSLVSTLQGDSELALAGAAADAISVNNVIELDAPQVRRVGSPVLVRPRINPRAVALVVHLADALVIATVGAVAYRLQPGFRWPVDPTVAFTALAMLAMLVRVPNAEPRLLHDSLRR